jgi:hypothetical protein
MNKLIQTVYRHGPAAAKLGAAIAANLKKLGYDG